MHTGSPRVTDATQLRMAQLTGVLSGNQAAPLFVTRWRPCQIELFFPLFAFLKPYGFLS